MKIKLHRISVIITFIYCSCVRYCYSQSPYNIHIYGSAYNFSNLVVVEDKSEFEDLSLIEKDKTFIPDSNYKFSVKFHLNTSNYYRIGRNIIYLSPGDKIRTIIDFNHPEKAKFFGNHANENTYLKNTPYPKMGSFLYGEDGIKNSIDETINGIITNGELREVELKKIKGKVDQIFYNLESIRIKADLINSLRRIIGFYSYVHKISDDSLPIISKIINDKISKYLYKYSSGILNSSYLKLEVYRNNVLTILSKQNEKLDTPVYIIDWIKGREIKSKALGLEQKADIALLRQDILGLKNNQYKKALLLTMQKLSLLNKGDIAKDFYLKDYNQDLIELSSFKNKVIYIDFWATWCGPCLENRKEIEKLKSEFKNNYDISIISISIDDDLAKWKKYIGTLSDKQNEFLIDRNVLPDYNIVTIPRAIIIDKNFRIFLLNAQTQNSIEIIKTLKDLLDDN